MKATWGVFAHTNYEVTPELELQAGVRYSGFESKNLERRRTD
jgi:opacity protein-like surface antigen